MATRAARIATEEAEILACFDVMAQLRPHVRREDFLERVRRQARRGYRLAYVEDGGRVRAAAGYRVFECLAWGKTLYVDDLVTDEPARSGGYGKALFDWLVARAREERCDEMHLDSGVQRHGAHRFYLRNRMEITSHHFRIRLG